MENKCRCENPAVQKCYGDKSRGCVYDNPALEEILDKIKRFKKPLIPSEVFIVPVLNKCKVCGNAINELGFCDECGNVQ